MAALEGGRRVRGRRADDEELEGRFLAPLVRSGRRGTWQSWPWWFALPLACLSAWGAVGIHAAYDQPLRPDVGYVVAQVDTCRVGLAPAAGAREPTVVVSTEDARGRCTGYEPGERLYYDASSTRPSAAASSGAGNGAFGTWALAVLAGLLVAAAVHDVVLRRRQLLRLRASVAAPRSASPGPGTAVSPAPAATSAPQAGAGLGSTRDDLAAVVSRMTRVEEGPVRDRLRRAFAGALLLDLAAGGHVAVTAARGEWRVALGRGPVPEEPVRDPVLLEGLASLGRHRFADATPRNVAERAALALAARQDAGRLTVAQALGRLATPAEDLVLSAVAPPRTADHADRFVEEVVAGVRSPGARSAPVVALLGAVRLVPLLRGGGARPGDGPGGPDTRTLVDGTALVVVDAVRQT